MAFATESSTLFRKAERVLSCGFCLLSRESWRRRKHGYVTRAVMRLRSSAHALVGGSVVSNTSGRALSPGGARASCVPFPT